MDTTPPAEPPRARPATGFFASVRSTGLYRADDRWVGGVCAGLAGRFGLDALLVRGLFAASVLLGGFGLVAYGVAWALLPEARDGRVHTEELLAGRFDVAVLGAAGFVVVGAARGSSWPWGVPGVVQGFGWLVLVGCLVAVVVATAQQRSGPPRPPTRYGPFPATGGMPGAGAPAYGPATAGAPGEPAYRPATGGAPGGPVPMAADDLATTALAVPPTEPVHAWGEPGATGAYAPPLWQAATTAPAAAAGAPTTTAWRPPAPQAARRRGPGTATVGTVLALSLLALAALLAARRVGATHVPVLLTGAGIALVLTGLGIVLAGLRGRRSGVLSLVAVLLLLAAAPFTVSGWTGPWQSHLRTGRVDGTVRLDTVDAAARGVKVGVGDLDVDLTGLHLAGTDTVQVPVQVGAGDLVVRVPSGTAVQADVQVGAGTIRWRVDGDVQTQDGLGLNRTFRAAGDDGTLRLQVSVGTGTVTIEED